MAARQALLRARSTRRAVFATAAACSAAALFAADDERLASLLPSRIALDSNDAQDQLKKRTRAEKAAKALTHDPHAPALFLWGSNEHAVVAPDQQQSEVVRRPRLLQDGLALRDLHLQETYGAAVDVNGDVLQWGDGFAPAASGDFAPVKTLRGFDIARLACTGQHIFALTRGGKVYAFPAARDAQSIDNGDSAAKASWLGWLWPFGASNPVKAIVTIQPDSQLSRGERFVDLSAGEQHVLARTSSGRAFACAAGPLANSRGQLGVRSVKPADNIDATNSDGLALLAPDPLLNEVKRAVRRPTALEPMLIPPGMTREQFEASTETFFDSVRTKYPPSSTTEFGPPAVTEHPAPPTTPATRPFSTTLHEIPSLRGIEIGSIKCGFRHSLFLLSSGRALALGANTHGQLGLGSPFAGLMSVEVPAEVSGALRRGGRVTQIEAGGDGSWWVVEREDAEGAASSMRSGRGTGRRIVELLAAGQGQFGAIGNGTWSHSSAPTRVKTVSGLLEFDERASELRPIGIHSLAAGPTHAAIVLDNAVGAFGRDVFVLGRNASYELGTGKRTNVCAPQHLGRLPYPASAGKSELHDPHKSLRAMAATEVAQTMLGKAAEKDVEGDVVMSGTTSPMPHSRMQCTQSRPLSQYVSRSSQCTQCRLSASGEVYAAKRPSSPATTPVAYTGGYCPDPCHDLNEAPHGSIALL